MPAELVSDEHPSPVSRSPADARAEQTRKPASFARLAQRISSWTTRGLLTAVVLVAGLGFGRQVLQWWRADADGSAANTKPVAADGLGDPEQLHFVRFGDQPWSMSRQSLAGVKEEAVKLLHTNCRLAAKQGGSPAGDPGAEERDFLALLAGRQPVEEEPGQWRMYAIDQALPMAVVVRLGNGDGARQKLTPGARQGDAASNPSRTESEITLADGGLRVVVWGLAFPSGADAWAVYTFQSESRAGRPLADMPDVPLPGGCKNTLTIRMVGGGAMIGFEGREEPENWRRFYEQWSAQRGWDTIVPWMQSGANWVARYAAPSDAAAGTVDILLAPGGGGRFTGLLLFTPM